MARRLTRLAAAVPVAVAMILLLLAWQFGATMVGLPAYILPRPFEIVANAIASAPLFGGALAVTASETILGFLLGGAIGLALAITMILAPPLESALIPLVVAINLAPSVAFVPLALIWFGLGIASKIAMAALAMSFVVLLNALAGLKRPEADAINLLRSFGAGRLGVLWRLQLPAAMPALVTGLRVGLARCAIVVIVAEMLGAYSGLGQIIYQSTAQLDTLNVWAAVFIASLSSLLLYAILVAVDRKLVWWR